MKWKTWAMALLCCVQMASAAAAKVPLMPIRDIQPGMQGVGKTVFQGDTIEEFPVEIVGVTGSESSGQNILVRLSGPLIDRAGGVAQGMSGSPVYVDGRLVGAIAFGRAFDDPHYCLLTPIGEMLKLVDMNKTQPVEWLPKGTSLTATGFSEEGLEVLRQRLGELGLKVVPGGDGSGEGAKPLEPGSAVGASYMMGDMRMGALGTVTWVDEDGRVLAFGHPFLQRGDCSFFMNKAWVLGCIPNLQSGYKIGNIGSAIGSFNQDRAAGIGGKLGKLPSYVPMFVAASDTGRGVNRAARMQLVKDEKLLPAMVDAAVTSAVSKAISRGGGGTARMKFEINCLDSKKEPLILKRENMYFAMNKLVQNINGELNDATTVLMNNKLEPVDIYGINVEVEVNDQVQMAEIKKVQAPKKAPKPGDKVPLKVTLKPFRGEEFTEIVEFKVPEKFEGDRMTLNVRGGCSMAWIVNLLRKQKDEGAPATKPKQEKQKTLKDYVKEVNEADCNNEIVVDISSGANNNANAEGGLAELLKGSPDKQKYPYDFVIDGEVEITIRLDK